ncbi:hypothetical protein [Streptomyces asiaticus]
MVGVTKCVEQITAWLAGNVALHDRVQGRDFRLALILDTQIGILRIAVTDARVGQLPPLALTSGHPRTPSAAAASSW